MKTLIILSIVTAIVLLKLSQNGSIATFSYILLSYIFRFDSNQQQLLNFDGEIEDGVFMHRFVKINKTFDGLPVTAIYHVVECGDANAEPIVFGHGLAENWKVWKPIMFQFCATHRAIAIDSEGFGQSRWKTILEDVPDGNSTSFMSSMQMQCLSQIGVRCFNLVITDYTFWTTLSMLSDYGDRTVIRYGKFQSVCCYYL